MVKRIISTKRLQIDKANASIVAFLAVASFVVMFSLVACRALLSQRSYQNRVIKEKKIALAHLKANNKAAAELVNSYKAFVAAPENIIGGNPIGTGDRDGDNARIILDALPSKYDFPALATSLEKILKDRKYQIDSITGTDDEVNQATQSKSNAKPVEMPVQLSVSGNFDTIQNIIDVLQRSIRPLQLDTMSIAGNDNALKVSTMLKTYYQPEKTINITTTVIK